ncbi:hypothetical protein DIPPA_33345 [Diplonema papillatum]|nr:hypothetical protein DIPPA_33345 [Diplonema papillatum]
MDDDELSSWIRNKDMKSLERWWREASRNDRNAALRLACKIGDAKTCERMVRLGGDVHAACPTSGDTLLHEVCRMSLTEPSGGGSGTARCQELVTLFISKRVDPAQANFSGHLPRDIAADAAIKSLLHPFPAPPPSGPSAGHADASQPKPQQPARGDDANRKSNANVPTAGASLAAARVQRTRSDGELSRKASGGSARPERRDSAAADASGDPKPQTVASRTPTLTAATPPHRNPGKAVQAAPPARFRGLNTSVARGKAETPPFGPAAAAAGAGGAAAAAGDGDESAFDYLNRTLFPQLSPALFEVAAARPDDPLALLVSLLSAQAAMSHHHPYNRAGYHHHPPAANAHGYPSSAASPFASSAASAQRRSQTSLAGPASVSRFTTPTGQRSTLHPPRLTGLSALRQHSHNGT